MDSSHGEFEKEKTRKRPHLGRDAGDVGDLERSLERRTFYVLFTGVYKREVYSIIGLHGKDISQFRDIVDGKIPFWE